MDDDNSIVDNLLIILIKLQQLIFKSGGDMGKVIGIICLNDIFEEMLD
jgi:hypothetical protein